LIAVDTNILVYAHRSESPKHHAALQWLRFLASPEAGLRIPLFCMSEFVSVVTRRGFYSPPSTLSQALSALELLLQNENTQLLMPKENHWLVLSKLLKATAATGASVFDAQIAALCFEHGIERILTEDKHFERFSDLSILTLAMEPGSD
jgi:toxin-antitoxin system PIN domain toxin